MDRPFASTTAYQAAEQGRVADARLLPPHVLRPDRVVYLDLHEDERVRRLEGRGGAVTREEARLRRDAAFASASVGGT